MCVCVFICAQLLTIRLQYSFGTVTAAMTFEFTQVNVGFPIGGNLPPAQHWKHMSHHVGLGMFEKRPVVHASNKLGGIVIPMKYRGSGMKYRGRGMKYRGRGMKYVFSCMNGGMTIVKYRHCSQSHALLVRLADPYWVGITCRPIDGDQVQIEAQSRDKELLWETTKGNDADVTIKDVSKDITEAIVSKNAATRQSKFNWTFAGKKVTKNKRLIKKKNR